MRACAIQQPILTSLRSSAARSMMRSAGLRSSAVSTARLTPASARGTVASLPIGSIPSLARRTYSTTVPTAAAPQVNLEFPNGRRTSLNGGLYIEYVLYPSLSLLGSSSVRVFFC